MNVMAQKINDAYAAEMLETGEAVKLAWADTETKRQSLTRSKGWVRVNFATGVAENVISAHAVRQRNGTVLALYQDAGGNIYMQPAVRPANVDGDFS